MDKLFCLWAQLNMQHPILTYQGTIQELDTPLSSYKNNSVLIILDTHIPEKYEHHGGKLSQTHVSHISATSKPHLSHISATSQPDTQIHRYTDTSEENSIQQLLFYTHSVKTARGPSQHLLTLFLLGKN